MKTYPALFYGIIVEQNDPEVLFNSFQLNCIMFVFMYPAQCVVCMVSGVCFRGTGTCTCYTCWC